MRINCLKKSNMVSYENVKGILLRVVMAVLLIAAFLMVTPSQANAASAKTKALKAYEKFLKKKYITIEDARVPLKECKFAVIYLDNNTVPELVLSFDMTSMDGIVGDPFPWTQGAIYTYKNGAVKKISDLSFRFTLKYYKKLGVLVDYSDVESDTAIGYEKLSGTRLKHIISKTVRYEWKNGKKKQTGTTYYDSNYRTISKAAYNKRLKSLVGSRKATKVVTRKNTSANRKKYLK